MVKGTKNRRNDVNMEIEDLYEYIDQCYVESVKVNDKIIGIITFDLGHTLNFYTLDGTNTDVQSIGDFSVDTTSLDKAIEKIREWKIELAKEWEY
jgi:hypothetical protein